MAFEPTREQKNAIEAKGTVLVSAAAGSGKTAVLVERVISRLLSDTDPVDADRLLIVTFTNAAAAEMRTRIERRLNEELEKSPNSPRLLRQQLLISKASICTIDSFCIDLVHDHFHRLQIEPNFKIADPGSLAPLKERAMSKVLENCYQGEDPAFFALLNALGSDYGDGPLVDAVDKIYESSRSMPFPEQWLGRVEEMYTGITDLSDSPWSKAIFRYACREADSMAAALRLAASQVRGVDKIEAAYLPALLADLKKLERLQKLTSGGDWDEVRSAVLDFKAEPLKPLRGFEDEALKEKVKSARESVNKRMGKLAGSFSADRAAQLDILRQAAPLISMLVRLVRDFGKELSAVLAERNSFGFADIEHLALDLLAEYRDGEIVLTPAADEICRRYDEILVDEYQDTNNLQDTLFYALSGRGRKLFMVGDVKQSIYRFRHANPDNFMHRKDTYPDYDGEASPSKIILGSNFRSREGICSYVNFFFGKLMSKEAGEMDYTDAEKLVPQAVFPETEESAVELHLLTCKEKEDRRELLEARHIARYIKESVSDGFGLRDERSPEQPRPARYGDFTILLRSPAGRAEVYLNELRRQNIPAYADIGGFFTSAEVMTMLSLLKTIDNPTRDVPLLGAMLSPMFGFTPTDLAEIRLADRKVNLFSAVTLAAGAGNEKCRRFLESLREYRGFAVTMPVCRLIERLYDATGYLAMVQAMNDGLRRRANLLLLIDYAKSFETGDYKGLTGFLRFMDKLNESGGLKSAASSGEGDNAVKIMSIHASKGLQFPVCILASGSSKFNRTDRTDSLLISERGGVGFKIRDDARHTRYSTLARDAISIMTDEAALAEELRLIYVAMTRAEEKLILLVTEDNLEKSLRRLSASLGREWQGRNDSVEPVSVLGAGGYSDWILMASLLHPDGKALRELVSSDLTPADADGSFTVRIVDSVDEPEPENNEEAAPPAAAPELKMEIARRLDYRYPYEALQQIESKMSVSRLVRRAEDVSFSCTGRPAFLSKSGLTPEQRGTATHKFMQYADYRLAEENLPDELERLASAQFLSPEEAAAIDTDALRLFFSGDLYRRIQTSPRVLREIRFLTEIPAGDIDPGLPAGLSEEPVVVQGVADCVFEEDGQLVILDFKTDRVRDPMRLAASYGDQLRAYAAALSKNYQMKVKECLLYSFALGCTVPVAPSL